MDNHEEEEKEEQVEQIEPPPTTNLSNDMELKLLPSSLSLLRHIMKPKLQFFNVSKGHLMLNVSRIYAHKITNLGTMFLRGSFKGSN